MRDEIFKAIIKRYIDAPTLKLCMWEDEDTVLVNISDDLDYKYSEEDILNVIKEILR